jgi:hypothetical protein
MIHDDKTRDHAPAENGEPAEDSRGNSIVQAAYSAAEVAGAGEPEAESLEAVSGT